MRTSTARRTLRVLWHTWKAELAAAAEYRANLLLGTVISAIWLAIAVAPTLVVFNHVEDAGGWTLSSLLFVQAIWYAMDAVLWIFLVPNFQRWSESVRSGDLDLVLVKPVNSLVLASLGSINPQDLPKLLLAGGLAVGAVAVGEGPASPLHLAAGLVAVLCGGCLLWAACVLANYKAITKVRFDATFAIHTVHNLARVPAPLYGPVVRLLLTVVVPVAFLTTVPAELFFGLGALWLLPVTVALALVATGVASRAWHRELRRYAGAMG